MANDFISTPSVPKFYFLNPRPEDILIGDIALALSHTCRFGGLCSVFYSVAEHSILVAKVLESEGASPLTVLAGMMHDAEETYIPDIPRPVKEMMPEAKGIYEILNNAIVKKYHLEGADWEHIKEIDDRLCTTEAKTLGIWNEEWESSGRPLDVKLYLWSCEDARQLFLNNFLELSEKCYDFVLRS